MSFQRDLQTILKSMAEFLIYSLAIAFVVVLLLLDIHWLQNQVTEYSCVEIAQELSLLIMMITFIRLAIKYQDQRNVHLLLAGFFCCLLIRELDSLFDLIVHGFWLYPALFVSFLSLTITLGRHPKQTLQQLAKYTRQPQYAYMIAGLICLLVFSRLFGMSILWQSLLKDDYVRVVKNVVEETTELLGYVFCLVSTLRYRHYFMQSSINNCL